MIRSSQEPSSSLARHWFRGRHGGLPQPLAREFTRVRRRHRTRYAGLSPRGAPGGPIKKVKECDLAHTMSTEQATYLSRVASRLRVGGVRAMEGAMLKAILCNKSVSRVEIDQRARDDRLRLEQIERRLVSRAAVTVSWLRRVLYLFSFGRRSGGSRTSRIQGPLNNRRPRMPQTHQGWVPSAP